ncbi:MAG: 1-phosphofructokinase family hexose kinase [Candidatus Tokpelaia sp.]|nr:MAG: 1-phosphofructokinase family hexose kinase [Candidatus Tokpelaia sp.]KAA6207208.1 MAG: 1-phosphofructokinase family hexose kinase [Candidatus Tokpelaia sp.]
MTEETAIKAPICAPVTCLALNPALDMTIGLDRLATGAVNRAQSCTTIAGGKGVNVAATLAAGGVKTAVTGILGRDNADFFNSFLAGRGIENHFLYQAGAVRRNIKLVSAFETTDINLPGLSADPALLEQLRSILAAAKSRFLVLAGSVPPHCPDSFYADFLQFYARQSGAQKARCVADCSGAALKALLSGAARPFCIKPNREELAEWSGKKLTDQAEILQEARRLAASGIALVAVSMGAEGALFVTEAAACCARITLDKVASTVGAGDAMVAGLIKALLEQTESDIITAAELENIAGSATLWAGAKLECAGPALPKPARLHALAQNLCCRRLY